MEHIRRPQPIRILLVSVPRWLGETITEEIGEEKDLVSIDTDDVTNLEDCVAGGGFELVLLDVTTKNGPATDKRLRASQVHVLKIGDGRALNTLRAEARDFAKERRQRCT